MKNYRPLLFEGIDLTVGGIQVSCLRLNRHTPETQSFDHKHDEHGQILVYLSGTGWQSVDGERIAARSGTVIYVAPGQVHAFERQQVRPLCLVLDLKLDPARPVARSVAHLNATELMRIRTRLSGLFGYRRSEPEAMVLQLGSAILDVLDPVMAALGWLGERNVPARRTTVTWKVERALAAADRDQIGLKELADRVGFQRDYLNRLLKAECGLSLGQLRARARLARAQKLLRERDRNISEVAEEIGIMDNNYFARWFKQQTGLTPSAWRAG